ncbi:MAG: C-GCAxxG-C-C family protein [Candidatus Bathyarchaeota archaeon]|nr:C-GCAxxG-C-C family protein [Candidatus Bathyarchaeota archaeon]
MITRGEIRFNCCESVLMLVNEKHPLPGFDVSTLRIASNFGGGIAGWGEICGAVSGAAMAIGLAYGTDGDEKKTTFDDLRGRERKITQEFIESFEERWGHLGCCALLGCKDCTPEARAKHAEELKARGENHCDEYVDWAAEKTLDIVQRNPRP